MTPTQDEWRAALAAVVENGWSEVSEPVPGQPDQKVVRRVHDTDPVVAGFPHRKQGDVPSVLEDAPKGASEEHHVQPASGFAGLASVARHVVASARSRKIGALAAGVPVERDGVLDLPVFVVRGATKP